jgi:branched-chain amino acid transport system substrate-binding protein
MRQILTSLAILGLGICGFEFGLAHPAHAQSEITIAAAGPMTGEYATFGDQFKKGAEAAVADINAAGGVLGRKLKLVIGDDACDPKQARSVAEDLASKGVVFVAGHYCSGSSIPASAVYNEAGVIQISPASTNPKYTDERPKEGYSYRVCGRDDQQGEVAGKYIAAQFKDKNVAIIDDKSTYGKGLADETRKAMNAAGKKEVFSDSITAGEKDYTAIVTKLKQANIDLVFLGGYHTEAGLIIRQMRAQGMKTILMGGDALVSTELGQIAGPDVEGTLLTFSPDPRKNPNAAEVVKKYKEKGIDPEGYVLYTYAAIQAWKGAVEAAKSTDAAKVKKALDTDEFNTVLGKFKFDKKGDPSLTPYVVYRWNKTTYEQIQ